MDGPAPDAVGELEGGLQVGADADDGLVLVGELDLPMEAMLGDVGAEGEGV